MSEIFTPFKLAGVGYLGIPRDNGVHVISEAGENFGAWFDIKAFAKARKRSLAGETEWPIAAPVGRCTVVVRPLVG